MKAPTKRDAQGALRRLAKGYGDRVYVRRRPDRKSQPSTHRGFEVRFIAHSAAERDEILSLLRAAGETPGKPFVTGKCWRVPLYGEEAVRRLAGVVRVPARPKAAKKKSRG